MTTDDHDEREDDFADAGHPDTWPAWCDDWTWTLGAGPEPEGD